MDEHRTLVVFVGVDIELRTSEEYLGYLSLGVQVVEHEGAEVIHSFLRYLSFLVQPRLELLLLEQTVVCEPFQFVLHVLVQVFRDPLLQEIVRFGSSSWSSDATVVFLFGIVIVHSGEDMESHSLFLKSAQDYSAVLAHGL